MWNFTVKFVSCWQTVFLVWSLRLHGLYLSASSPWQNLVLFGGFVYLFLRTDWEFYISKYESIMKPRDLVTSPKPLHQAGFLLSILLSPSPVPCVLSKFRHSCPAAVLWALHDLLMFPADLPSPSLRETRTEGQTLASLLPTSSPTCHSSEDCFDTANLSSVLL